MPYIMCTRETVSSNTVTGINPFIPPIKSLVKDAGNLQAQSMTGTITVTSGILLSEV